MDVRPDTEVSYAELSLCGEPSRVIRPGARAQAIPAAGAAFPALDLGTPAACGAAGPPAPAAGGA